jgi:hypothetical protein
MIRSLPIAVVLTLLTSFACSPSSSKDVASMLDSPEVLPTITDSVESRYNGIPLPLPKENRHFGVPPPAWLIFNEQAFPALNAAFQTVQAHGDPAEAFPDLFPVPIPAQAQFIIIIASKSVTEFRASVVPWDPHINPLPLIERDGEFVRHTIQEDREFTVFTLTAIYPTKEQFLHVFMIFSQSDSSSNITGYAHYLWRITLDK